MSRMKEIYRGSILIAVEVSREEREANFSPTLATSHNFDIFILV